MTDRYTRRLKEIFDVLLVGPTNNQALLYNASTGLWGNNTVSASSGTGGFTINCQWIVGQNPNNKVLIVAPQAISITGIVGRLEIANAGVSTLSVVKAISGTAITAGTLLHTGSFNAQGTAATNQTLALVTTSTKMYQNTNGAYEGTGLKVFQNTALTTLIKVGDAIGIQTTGVYAASAGCITISATWQ